MVETNECDCATTNLADMERELGRAAFEAWTTSWWGEGVVLTRNSLDLYDKDGVQSAWEGWRGRGWYEQANVKDHVCAKDLEPAK